MTRDTLIELLRGKESDLAAPYNTVRHGTVPSFHGWVVVGDELLVGHPPRGTPNTLYSVGQVTRRSLSEITTGTLAKAAWSMGLIGHAAKVAACSEVV